MAEPFDLVLSGGTIVNHDGAHAADLGIRAGRVAEIGDLSNADTTERQDCRGLHL
ncbi:MAG: dihydroorotase, partial [Methylobacterium sp. CG09_land_8_20_14_0_10_71_15]